MQSDLCWLAVLVPAIVLSPAVAQANTATEGASSLMPLELRAVSAEPDTNNLTTAADQINQSLTPADTGIVSVTDEMPFLNDLLDENGDIALPMGLTVFTTLGDPSIGFGSNF
ncbi:hypothetical protein [Pseudanabaena sp. FACHB-2040]|uniref:hypothetical protein n=1 Tax=Pseudanabaena sp. FACHB-2040 TaxID=2692859 RepID=UPI001688313F|nr:hypothetical protein [Pseudanabaena sp. FACHB-2040]MBD2258621.1 hypothetical protein [Pseudanabaena sp. FACHB-2040]